MTEPLGQSQVLPYLRGLAKSGWSFDLVGFEPSDVPASSVEATVAELARSGITYHVTRRSGSHRLEVKLLEAARALARASRRAVGARPRIVHARGHLPAAVAGAMAALVPGARFVFDLRGLLGEEYLDAGHWRRDWLR